MTRRRVIDAREIRRTCAERVNDAAAIATYGDAVETGGEHLPPLHSRQIAPRVPEGDVDGPASGRSSLRLHTTQVDGRTVASLATFA